MRKESVGHQIVKEWFHLKGWNSFDLQEEVWESFLDGKNGLLNAPTGNDNQKYVRFQQVEIIPSNLFLAIKYLL